jgi:hypothetical protein
MPVILADIENSLIRVDTPKEKSTSRCSTRRRTRKRGSLKRAVTYLRLCLLECSSSKQQHMNMYTDHLIPILVYA